MLNIYATLVSFNDKGILFIGESGSGKSDLALRMIEEKGAKLVADDRVDVEVCNGKLIGKSPEKIKNLLEIRNVGITNFDALDCVEICLCVELVKDRLTLERLPYDEHEVFLGVKIPKIKLFAFDCSTVCKIIVKISSIINKRW